MRHDINLIDPLPAFDARLSRQAIIDIEAQSDALYARWRSRKCLREFEFGDHTPAYMREQTPPITKPDGIVQYMVQMDGSLYANFVDGKTGEFLRWEKQC